MTLAVYEFNWSIEDERPEINFSDARNQGEAWEVCDEVVRNERPAVDHQEFDVFVDNSDATQWHGYLDGIALGFYSDGVRAILEPHVAGRFEFLPIRLNQSRYWTLRPVTPIDCFDRDKAVFELFSFGDPPRVMSIDQFAFKASMLNDPSVFWIPESWGTILITQSVHQEFAAAELKGIKCTKLWSA